MNNLFDNNLFDMETEPQYEPLAEPQAPVRTQHVFRLFICTHYSGAVCYIAARNKQEAISYSAGIGMDPMTTVANDRTEIIRESCGREKLMSILSLLKMPRQLNLVGKLNQPTTWLLVPKSYF
jgi:hypothetical protein